MLNTKNKSINQSIQKNNSKQAKINKYQGIA